jgi:hypothetical protein
MKRTTGVKLDPVWRDARSSMQEVEESRAN